MLPHKPEDWPVLFERYLNTGDLEAAAALYDPEAVFVPRSGEALRGREAIRSVLSGLLDQKPRMHGKVVKVVAAGDVAVLYTDWHGTVGGAEHDSRAVEVLSGQPEGTWRLVVGDPDGRA